MTDGWAVVDTERLPWLADQEISGPPARAPRAQLLALPMLPILAGVSYWLGITGGSIAGDAVLPPPHSVTDSGQERVAPMEPSAAEQLRFEPTPGSAPVIESAVVPVERTPKGAQRVAQSMAVRLPQPVPAPPAAAHELQAPAACSATVPAHGCVDADLPRLNNTLALLYSQSWGRADPARRQHLLRTHDPFVRQLNACESFECRRSVYVSRMRQVGEIIRRDWQTPLARHAKNPKVATLDRQLALLYSQSWSRAAAEKRAKLLRTQRPFVERLDECQSVACLNRAYLARMREVSTIMAARS